MHLIMLINFSFIRTVRSNHSNIIYIWEFSLQTISLGLLLNYYFREIFLYQHEVYDYNVLKQCIYNIVDYLWLQNFCQKDNKSSVAKGSKSSTELSEFSNPSGMLRFLILIKLFLDHPGYGSIGLFLIIRLLDHN